MTKKIAVSGVGCSLVDYLFNNVSFTSEIFSKYLSKKPGDGGLSPGHLVFTEEFEKYCGYELNSVIQTITGNRKADKINIGGPGIVALIHIAQMLENSGCTIQFYGARGNDSSGEYIQTALSRTPVNTANYKTVKGVTPSTIVLSDPNYNYGDGERVFINSIGAAWNYLPEYLDEQFFSSDVVVFGGTALVPVIHDNLTELLIKAKTEKAITVVNTVYDFRNQKAAPDKKWPMGKSDNSYHNIDLLITNHEEALRLSGQNSLDKALEFYKRNGTGAVVVTNGTKNVTFFAKDNSIFNEIIQTEMPISSAITKKLAKGSNGDTTGCGDNFAGGVIASVVEQLQKNKTKIDLKEAVRWGIVSGGYTCFYMGGTFLQKNPGEKRKLIAPYYDAYLKQIDE